VGDKKTRQTTNASSAGSTMIYSPVNPYVLGTETGSIIVRQVIGEAEQQKVLDINVVVPDPKPAIEQIIDVFVKEVDVTGVDVITDKVIVRGQLEIKAIYVAAQPDQAVHAVEIRHVRWTQDVTVFGARRGMDAEASVVIEFVDYDVEENTHAYRHKYGVTKWDDECEEEEEEVSEETCAPPPVCPGLRQFDVSVVLKVTAKVLTDREVYIGPAPLPVKPKG